MAPPAARYFPHRQNKDGSYDTVCPKCFAIVANVKTEAELVDFKQEHVCNQPPNTWVFGA
jgi:hypothetical protein